MQKVKNISTPTFPRLKGQYIAVDTETDGLDPYHGARIFCFALMTEKGEYGFYMKTPESIKYLKKILNDRNKTVIFQKAKFDLLMLSFEGVDVLNLKAHIDCTLNMSKVINSTGMSHDLRSLAKRYLGVKGTQAKDEIEDYIKANGRKFTREYGRKMTFKDVPLPIVKKRIRWDVEQTLRIYAALKKQVESICPNLYETERQLIFVCIDMELYGVCVDLTRAKKLRKQAIHDLKKISTDLNRLIGKFTVTRYKTRTRKGEKFKEEIPEVVEDFNPGSPIHLVAAFEKVGIKLEYKTKPKKSKDKRTKVGGGNWCFDEYAMIRYSPPIISGIIRESGEEGWTLRRFYKAVKKAIEENNIPKKYMLPPLILRYRQVSKMISTYYDHFINKCVDKKTYPNGREYGILHCNFNQSEAVTGRFSSSNPNLQNQPRKIGPRECFVPRIGKRNWHWDYEQVEMKFFVHFAEDERMAKAIADDIHLHVAAEVYSKPVEDISGEQRKRAKATNFGIIYGSGPETQAETLTRRGLVTTTSQTKKFLADYHRRFPSVRTTTNSLKTDIVRFGYVVNPFGRRYHLTSRFSYKALNYLCQGTSADQMKKAMVDLWHYLKDNKFKARLVMTIHDEIVIEIPRCEEKELYQPVQDIMEDHHSYFIPVTVDAKIVDTRWSEKKNLKDVIDWAA